MARGDRSIKQLTGSVTEPKRLARFKVVAFASTKQFIVSVKNNHMVVTRNPSLLPEVLDQHEAEHHGKH
ncbi:hypothetical protein DPMN_146801 [Dreissena polymorpha]|uniref:Uncharacterized protein n=1 Tax=Dreissena polymorpha TaxID=45954 RepID=A0A9D4J2D0_DREPO|nr:hypothetical protein DPMN_146801 [Dreissena polymorpha]